ncbi:EFR1 family ferrodoxin [Enterococcus sp. DIV0756]|uniref:EFR1 family ferrodoxin n=1 Tax=Enterococcus sp. DIV0756 TaxID=2774636 RepID=UPI003F23331F
MEKKILILYFSGASSTRKIAKKMSKEFSLPVAVHSIEHVLKKNLCMTDFSAIVIGTPVYHGEPAKILLNWIEQQEKLTKPIPVMIYSTCGLGQYNTNRILAKKLVKKNLITIYSTGYRSPSSDGTLLVTSVNLLFRFEKNIESKVHGDVQIFVDKLDKGQTQLLMPRFHFSSVLNLPNKTVGKSYTFRIYLHKEVCINCMKCKKNCPYQAIDASKANSPVINIQKCENCYRCVHHCTVQALSLSKKKRPKKQLI